MTKLERLAEVIRRISAVAVGRPLSDEALTAAAVTLESVAGDPRGRPPSSKKRPRTQPTPDMDPQDLFPTSPVIGRANPIAPPAYIWTVEGEDGRPEIRGRVTFDYPYEGPPTCVHGGIIAEIFDELLGAANIIAETAGMTGTLTVRYRKPTPLLVPLDLVARVTGTERRKSFAWGGIYHEGVLTAEAEGIFIAMNPGKMLEIVTTNAKESEAPVVDPDFVELIGRAKDAASPSS